MNLLGMIVPWWGRWAALLALVLAAAAFGAAKMHQHDQAKYDAREAAIKAAALKQNELTLKQTALFQTYKESADEEALHLREARDRAVFDANRLRLAASHTRLVPTAPSGAQGSGRICYSPDQLDREISAALDDAAGEDLQDAALGQHGIDVATVARDHAQAVINGVMPKPGFQRVRIPTRSASK